MKCQNKKCSGLCDDSCFIIPPGDKTRQNGALKKVYADVLFDKGISRK